MNESFSASSSLVDALRSERAKTLDQIAALTRDWNGIVEAAGQTGVDDEHDPEGATIAFERSQVEALLVRARRHLDDVDRAIDRVHAGTYGTCERCGGPIAPARLAARPAARVCITCAAR